MKPNIRHAAVRSVVAMLATSCGLVVASAVFEPPSLSAQELTGRVLDGSSEAPIDDALLFLLHPDGYPVGDSVTSTSSGAFTLAAPGPGSWYIQIEKLGYTTVVDGVFDFASASARLEVTAYLLPAPVELEGVDVAVERAQIRRSLRAQGFYERLTDGFGDFVTPEEIEAMGLVSEPSELLRGIPGVRTMESLVLFRAMGVSPGDGQRGCSPNSERTGPPSSGPLFRCGGDGSAVALGLCEPDVWLDGTRMTKANSNGFLDSGDFQKGLDAYLTGHDILAVEVYRRISGTPLRFAGLGNTCGTIVIWTKQGR